MKQQLIEFLQSIIPVDSELLGDYADCWSFFECKKKSILTRPGDTEKYLYFVLQGIQKSYFLTEEKQHIIAFAYSPSFSGVVDSFFVQEPSFHFLQAITDSQFLRIPFSKHEEYMLKHLELSNLFRVVSEMFLRGVIQRQQELLALDMGSRFNIFVARSPHLLNMISQKDLASYLRIDPTNFSKLLKAF